MSIIKGVHHICIKAVSAQQLETAVKFYTETLGLPVVRRWGEGEKSAVMVDAGGVLIEMMANGTLSAPTVGSVNHFALMTDEVDDLIAAIRGQGYRVTMEPQNKDLPCRPPLPVRIAFFEGPLGELVELFCERKG
ncbi:VOC family protein [Acidaminobacterium chupaoyuni]